MPAYNLPFFGEINSGELEEYYDVTIALNGNPIKLDIRFDEEHIDTHSLNALAALLGNLTNLDSGNKTLIERDYAGEGDTVKTYIDHHLEDMDADELSGIVDMDNTTVSPQQQMLKAFRLVRVGFYPDDEANFAIFDYSIDPEQTQYLVVISRNKDGQVSYITMES